MIIIGEKLNSSIPSSLAAMQSGGDDLIRLIELQKEAELLDLNTALTGDEEGIMRSVLPLIRERSDCGVMLDSPDPEVLCRTLPFARGLGLRVIVNSVKGEEKYLPLMDAAARHSAGVVVMPELSNDVSARVASAKVAADMLISRGVKVEDIYVDALAAACATDGSAAITALDTVTELSRALPGAKTLLGLSNVSFGLPGRAGINAVFLSMAMARGLSAAILDPSSPDIIKALRIGNALLGEDEYCLDYIEYFRG